MSLIKLSKLHSAQAGVEADQSLLGMYLLFCCAYYVVHGVEDHWRDEISTVQI